MIKVIYFICPLLGKLFPFSLTVSPEWLIPIIFPFTEPMKTEESEQRGEEKNGTLLEYVHKSFPLSWTDN